MGYRAEKLKVERQIKLLKRILLSILLVCILALCIFSAFVPPKTWKYRVSLPKVSKCPQGSVRIHFLDVGQGDATLIELPDGKVVLIDGGDGSSTAKRTLIRYINALKIDKIDHLIVTHTDADHCGGLYTLLEQKRVLNAYLPPSFSETDGAYAKFYAALLKTDCERYTASRALQITGGATADSTQYNLFFVYPQTLSTEQETEDTDANASSAVVWLDYHNCNVLFMGDAPAETEAQILLEASLGILPSNGMDLSGTEILKVSHHGSGDSTTAAFLEYLNAKEAVISCGAGNVYGHPDEGTLQRLQEAGASVHRTDTDGTIVATIDQNGRYTITKSKN